MNGRHPRTCPWGVPEIGVLDAASMQSLELPPEGERTPSPSPLRELGEGSGKDWRRGFSPPRGPQLLTWV